jgi:two-component system sensor histidine kinase KdpD
LKEKSAAARCHISVPRQEVPVIADRKLVISALAQLIDNAIKYSVPESQININITMRDAEVVIAVQNEGQMIAPAHRERIFDRFYRAPGTEQRPAGTGLGLSIVRRIAEAHYGRVWTEGDADHGTIFVIALPAFRNE